MQGSKFEKKGITFLPVNGSARTIYVGFWVVVLRFVAPMGIFPVGKSGHFPQGKPAATESRYPNLRNYKVHAGSFRVSVIH